MKTYKYLGVFLLSLGFIACDVNNELEEIQPVVVEEIPVNGNSIDFSNYVAIGASFSAGLTDGGLFKATQENSFPNILASKFALAGGGDFKQPLMADNIGGLLFAGNIIQGPRLFFNGSGSAVLQATPTTEVTNSVAGDLNNYGIPGAKSFHFVAPGYGNLAGVPLGLANPYFARMASSASTSVLADALGQNPTFFTLSEIGGNDVLLYALAGGTGVDQSPTTTNPAGNLDPSTYGGSDITNPLVFANVFDTLINGLTAGGRKGVVANVPYITTLAHFTQVPFNPVPLDAGTAGAVNTAYAAYNGGIQQAFGALVQAQVFTQAQADAEIAKRTIKFAAGQNAVVIIDENLTDLGAINPAFAALQQLRQTTAADLLVLPSSNFIGTLADPSNPASVNGIGVALGDKWVVTPEEQAAIKKATDAYNVKIESVVQAKGLALVDFKAILETASTTGIAFDNYILKANLVTGSLISLDGFHLTSRGYALLANKMLEAIDATYGSNFTMATHGLAKAGDYPTNYSPMLR